MSFCFHLPSVPLSPLGAGPGAGMRARSVGPAAGYVRRNHRTYSSVARTTSPCSVVVVVYVSKGGALDRSRSENASASRRSFNLSRLRGGVGVALVERGEEVEPEHP